MNDADPYAASDFGTGLSQHARLFTITSAAASGARGDALASLAAERFVGREAVNALFCFDIDALSTSTDLDLGQFVGTELTLSLLQPDGSLRHWHGLCTRAAWRGADGGVARYRLRLEPALALLAKRRDSYIFQHQDLRAIVTELLFDYPQVRFEFQLSEESAPRAICTQYRESDLDFLLRLLVSEGLNFRFEHTPAECRLVIFDSRAPAPPTPGEAALRFHGVRATEHDDAIDHFSAARQFAANAVAISSWDPGQLCAPGCEQRSVLDNGTVPLAWVMDGSGERIASSGEAARRHSDLMLLALEMANKTFSGSGAVRRLAAGHGFTLTQHQAYGDPDNQFTVTWVEHEARNNFTSGIRQDAGARVERGSYRNRFGCVRDTVRIVPAGTALAHPVTAPGPQVARVVGLANSVATTNRDHAVRIQFAWQRGAHPNRGGLAHDVDPTGCAPGDERAGTWVRVAEALAGPNWGTQFIPRLGTEVLVNFIEGDIDRPLIVGQLYTGVDLPPFGAGFDTSAGHAGTLSGIHTTNFDGAGFNQWQLDDTPGQLRTRLATSSGASQLSLGYLVEQAPGSARRGAYRGSGFELRTDAWACVRGGAGVLLSTMARPRAGCGVSATQMDTREALALLRSAQTLAGTLADAASAQQALASRAAARAQADLIARIDPQAEGRHPDSVNGQRACQPAPGTRTPDPGLPVERFGQAQVLLASAASINWATAASTVLYAGRHLHLSSQADLHLAAAHTVSTVAGQAASLFTHGGGIEAIAAHGPVSLQAHTDKLEILADQHITVISVNDSIEIKAREKVVLQAGQCAITLEGGNITFACPGTFSVKGGTHTWDGPHNAAPAFEVLPTRLAQRPAAQEDERTQRYDEQIVYQDKHGNRMPKHPFVAHNTADEAQRQIDHTPQDGTVDRFVTGQAQPIEYALRYSSFKLKP